MLAAACGKSNSKSQDAGATPVVTEATTDPQFQELSGTWAKDCVKAPVGGVPGGVIEAQTFTKDHVLNSITSYSDSTCTQVRSRIVFVAAYQTGALLAGSQTRRIDYTSLAVAGAVGSDAAALAWLNTNKFCGFGDWTSGVAKALTGLDCVQTFVSGTPVKSGDKSYDVYQVVNGKLQNGLVDAKTADGKSDANRPLNLDPNNQFSKQSAVDSLASQLPALISNVKSGTTVIPASPTVSTSKVTLLVPELTSTADPANFLRLDMMPANPFLSVLSTQFDAVNTTVVGQLPAGVYAVTASLIANANKSSVLKSGTTQLTVQANAPQTFTIDIK